jgi:hypothetical protein
MNIERRIPGISLALAILLSVFALTMVVCASANAYWHINFSWGENSYEKHAWLGPVEKIVNRLHVWERTLRWPLLSIFLFWLYRHVGRLRSEAMQLSFSPTGAVAAFVVPVLNLWSPRKVMSELDRVAARASFAPVPWQAMPTSATVLAWFVAWDFAVAAATFEWSVRWLRRQRRDFDLSSTIALSMLERLAALVQDVGGIACCLLSALLVLRISRR